eukprot:364659-Chlamydomonas_euryale.AAC.2
MLRHSSETCRACCITALRDAGHAASQLLRKAKACCITASARRRAGRECTCPAKWVPDSGCPAERVPDSGRRAQLLLLLLLLLLAIRRCWPPCSNVLSIPQNSALQCTFATCCVECTPRGQCTLQGLPCSFSRRLRGAALSRPASAGSPYPNALVRACVPGQVGTWSRAVARWGCRRAQWRGGGPGGNVFAHIGVQPCA